MRVVADSHALVWFTQENTRLSARASEAMEAAVVGEGLVVSAATLPDLWYVSRTTKGVSEPQMAKLREVVQEPGMRLQPIDLTVVDAFMAIDRDAMRDPWDRLIVATAQVLDVPLVTRDRLITKSGLVETVW